MTDISGVREDLFIGGEFRPASSDKRIPVTNPATEAVFGEIPDGDVRDVDASVSAADLAFRESGWPQLAPAERAQHIRRLADLIEGRGEELGRLVTAENGMPLANSIVASGAMTARHYRYVASLADQLEVETERPSVETLTVIRRQPVGVAALILPWNGPQLTIAWKLAPALAAGCTAVIKPAPETSLDAYVFAELVREAGIPSGVVNIVTGGRDTGAMLAEHPRVRKVGFTGSTVGGRAVALAGAADFKRVTLELGGKAAAILLDDVDLETFAELVPSVCMRYSGQVCRALTRIVAPRARYQEVVDAVVAALDSLTVGDPLDPATDLGPLVSARQRERVEGFIRSGQAEGAKIALGGERLSHLERGYYVAPTVFRDADNSMRIAREEIFGPVVTILSYDGVDEAIEIANDSSYGLGGAVFTADEERGMDVARLIESGSVGVNHYVLPMNAPFGGVKQSGLGREQGPEGLAAYLETKAILCRPVNRSGVSGDSSC